jgi:3-oxoacyl-[acyl-carrier-protein] synthase III
MNTLVFQGIEIVAIAACVPKDKIRNEDFAKHLFPDELLMQKTIETIGVKERHVASNLICSSDLCFAAAEKLILETKIDRSEIDVLIFVSQTPDYRLPATAIVLQNKLGLSKQTIAFDVNLGCSGYVYGLSIAYSFANNMNAGKVLLLVGDTPSKFTSELDKSSALLFGDAGTATLIEKTKSETVTSFNLFSDGNGENSLIIKSGGFRNPSNESSFELESDEDGNVRHSGQLYMNGGEIFNFTLREVPRSIIQLLDYNEKELLDINHFIFHQANKFMIDFLCKKMKILPGKFLMSLENYGNTSAASIPLTLVTNKYKCNYNQVLMAGFGVGLSWGNCCTTIVNTHILDLIEL